MGDFLSEATPVFSITSQDHPPFFNECGRLDCLEKREGQIARFEARALRRRAATWEGPSDRPEAMQAMHVS